MFRQIALGALLATGGLFAADIEFNLSASPMSVLSGDVKSLFENALKPKPENINITPFGVGLRIFFLKSFGLLVEGDIPATATAVVSGYKPLKIFNYGELRVGPVLRIPFAINDEDGTYHAIKIFGGGLMGWYDLEGEFKSLITGASFYAGPATGFSGFAGLEYTYKFVSFAHFSIGVRYHYFNVQYPQAKAAINGNDLYVPITFGLSFGQLHPKKKTESNSPKG